MANILRHTWSIISGTCDNKTCDQIRICCRVSQSTVSTGFGQAQPASPSSTTLTSATTIIQVTVLQLPETAMHKLDVQQRAMLIAFHHARLTSTHASKRSPTAILLTFHLELSFTKMLTCLITFGREDLYALLTTKRHEDVSLLPASTSSRFRLKV